MQKSVNLTLPEGTLVPNHLAIIPDGNRRWARARGRHTLYGHKKGFDRAIELARAARKWGVHTVTLWGFSTENWDRSEAEIKYLMKLYCRLLDNYLKDAHKEKIRIVHLGRKDRLPKFLLETLASAEEQTKNYKNYIANVAIDYGGHDDIIRAVKGMIKDGVTEQDITKATFEKYLDTHDQPYPYVDLLVRSSGEQRTSGLLLWQMEYAEMYWETDHFPDFTPAKLRDAILDYSRRRRRFGGNDNVNHFQFKPQVIAKFELAWWRLGKIPEGTKFSEYSLNHVKEQYGLTVKLAGEASTLMLQALAEGNQKKWKAARKTLNKFYELIKEEVKLTFEPSIVASIQVKLMQKIQSHTPSPSEIEELSTELVAEIYRISQFQASKAGHLRALAEVERNKAISGLGENHWTSAKQYLELYYQALKDRVA
jgi:undecaprenyl diphosphate synthase